MDECVTNLNENFIGLIFLFLYQIAGFMFWLSYRNLIFILSGFLQDKLGNKINKYNASEIFKLNLLFEKILFVLWTTGIIVTLIDIKLIILNIIPSVLSIIVGSIRVRKNSEIDYFLFKTAKQKHCYRLFVNRKTRIFTLLGSLINSSVILSIEKFNLSQIKVFKICLIIYAIGHVYDLYVSIIENKIMQELLKNGKNNKIYRNTI